MVPHKCPICDGEGVNPKWFKVCIPCNGSGIVWERVEINIKVKINEKTIKKS